MVPFKIPVSSSLLKSYESCLNSYIHIHVYIYIYAHPPPNGPTAGSSRVLARSREKQQNKKLTKAKKQKKQNTKKPKKKKNTKNNIFSKTMGLGPPKDCFFWFSGEKDGFLVWNHLFLEKKMVFRRMVAQNHLFLEKTKKPKTKKNIFWRPQPHSFGKDVFFWLFFWLFLVFLGFVGFLEILRKTIFFSRRRWFYQGKTSKNHLFLEKKMVPNQKKPSFSRENQKKPSFGGPSPIVLEKMAFWFFWVWHNPRDSSFRGLIKPQAL